MRLFRALMMAALAAAMFCSRAQAGAVATGCLTVTYPGIGGNPSYLDAPAAFDSGPFPDGIYDVFCANGPMDIYLAVNYRVVVYPLNDPAITALGLVQSPANLVWVQWILSQGYPGLPSSGFGNFNSDDVQAAIWILLDGFASANSLSTLPSYSQDRVNEILAAVADEQANGGGLQPLCSGVTAYLANPVAATCGQGSDAGPAIAQPLIFGVPKTCPGPPDLTSLCAAENAGEVGMPYDSALVATGGTPPFSFSITSGGLPAGLVLNPGTGAITGVPTEAGSFAFTYNVTDSAGGSDTQTASGSCTITIVPRQPVTYCVQEAPLLNGDLSHAVTLPGIGTDFIFGAAAGQLVDHGDGTATLTGKVYSRSNPTLGWQINVTLTGLVAPPAAAPAGSPVLELPATSYSPTGSIEPSSWTYQTGLTGTLTGIGGYAGGLIAISRTGPAWQEGIGANGKNHNYGASASLDVSVVNQPSGETLTPSSQGGFNLNIATVCQSPVPPVNLECVSKISGTVGMAYSSSLQASGGAAPYTFSISAGALPPGLTLNPATGAITGVPTAAGTFNFTATVVDYFGVTAEQTDSANCAITIAPVCTPVTLGCVSSTPGTVGTVYSATLNATGGTAPYRFYIIYGSLPPGLSLNVNTGTISGTPSTAGTFYFTAKVVDSSYSVCGCNRYDTVCCSIKINPPPSDCACLVSGDTATIGYWNGPNGQALIKSLNGGSSSKLLANWLASNFPYLYGAYAGSDNLTGKSNADVAALFKKFFAIRGQKTKAQTLAAALAVYVTNSGLAGNTATAAGFNVSAAGTGAKCYNVGCYGSAIGLTNNRNYTVLALLRQANLKKQQGCLNSNAFNSIFDGINVKGDRR